MARHVIVGSGAVGTAAATLLAERGEHVRLISRSGGGPAHPAVECLALDASDAAALTRAAEGAEVVYNCANPAYHRWLTDWPPLAASLRAAAEHTGAVLATAGNLYGYGAVAGPMTERTPLAARHPKLRMRAQMWTDDLAAHRAGRLRTTEVRASDYIEANSVLSFVLAAPLLAGRRAYAPVPLDVPHSWTSVTDVARTLVTVASDERAWGRAWHVPTNEALTVRQLATRFCEVAGAPAPRLSAIPYAALWTYGVFDPFVRELRTTRYQFAEPFLLDSSLAQQTFGLQPTPMEQALDAARAAHAAPAASLR